MDQGFRPQRLHEIDGQVQSILDNRDVLRPDADGQEAPVGSFLRPSWKRTTGPAASRAA